MLDDVTGMGVRVVGVAECNVYIFTMVYISTYDYIKILIFCIWKFGVNFK